MRMQCVSQNISFTRAFTKDEKKSYVKLINDARKELGIKDTCAIVFDFNVPDARGHNTGIGSTWSKNSQEFVKFLKDMAGITSIQVEPQGRITQDNHSPYSGTNWAWGEHIIDLLSLEGEEFGNILPFGYTRQIDKDYDGEWEDREYRANYSYALDKQSQALHIAFENFKNLNEDENPALIQEYRSFLKENGFWLEKECIFRILSDLYKTDDFEQWEEYDQNLYSPDGNSDRQKARIKEIIEQNKDQFDYLSFVQFIADKQQKIAKQKYNEQGIKLYGDRPIGSHNSEVWANQDCFMPDKYFGSSEVSWMLRAIDYGKIGKCDDWRDISELGESGKYLYTIYKKFFERYDSVRIDAAWQFVTPVVYNKENQKFLLDGLENTVFNIIRKAAYDVLGDKFDPENPENIMPEVVCRTSERPKEITKNVYPHVYSTLLYDYPRGIEYYKQEGFRDDAYYLGLGCHDDDTINNKARDDQFRETHINALMREYDIDMGIFDYDDESYQNSHYGVKRQEDFRNLKYAEIMSAKKNFFTLPDMFGMSERINVANVVNDTNWQVRIPTNYEKFYYSQLSKGYGMNTAKALSSALVMKHSKNQKLIDKLNEAANILRQKGPLSEKEAQKLYEQGKLGKTLDYSA